MKKRPKHGSRPKTPPILRQPLFWSLLFSLLVFRTLFGLAGEFWFVDELQVYLIGLKYYTTGLWPFYGPDVTLQVQNQLPGALLGLLVGLPLRVLAVPESPIILLNLLSFAALAFFSWYLCRRMPSIPPWFIWTWTMTAPWTLHFSTHVTNPSYMLASSLLFLVGFLETLPSPRRPILPAWAGNAGMGFAVLWCAQFHLSWVMLVPFLLYSLVVQWRASRRDRWMPILSAVGGGILPGSLLVPTFLQYGFSQGMGATDMAARFNPGNIGHFFTILGRYLSFASFELTRFVGANAASRAQFFQENLWLVPLAVFAGVVGFLQPALLLVQPLVQWFSKKRRTKTTHDWRVAQATALSMFLLLWVFFWISAKPPAAHTFYVALPFILLQSFHVWEPHLKKSFWRKFAAAFLICGVLYHAGYALVQVPKRSLYKDRGRAVESLQKKDYRILGERREGTFY